MGAQDVTETVWTQLGYREALDEVCDDLTHEYGYGAYSGTLATCRGGVQLHSTVPVTEDAAQALVGEMFEKGQLRKWESVVAVPLLATTPAKWVDVNDHTVEVTMSVAVYRDQDRRDAALMKAAGVRKARTRSVRVSRVVPVNDFVVSASATEGLSQTRYFFTTPGGEIPAWETGFVSQKDARAALRDPYQRAQVLAQLRLAPFGAGASPVELVLQSVTRRVSGEPVLTATLTPRTVMVRATVISGQMVAPAKVGTTREGWLFAGVAAS